MLTGLKLGKSYVLYLSLILSCHLSNTSLTAAKMATSATGSDQLFPKWFVFTYTSNAQL